jgi:RNA polymerase sigma-70 factor (ECF subfamily)
VKSGKSRSALFDRLYRRFGGLVYAVARQILKDHQQAQDASQEAWLRIYQSLSKRNLDLEFVESWILTIARNEARRRRKARLPAVPLVREPASTSVEERESLREALRDVPAEDRELLRRRYLAGEDCEEIARDLGRAPSTVYRRIGEARDRLLRALRRA